MFRKMNSLRRWLYRPKRSDPSLLAQFYFADEELNLVAAELDGFEGRKDPERCAALVNQLRACQARVLNIVSQMMDDSIKDHRALRDFRVKFPDDVIQENLAGQLWFGAECLAAGSSIMNREVESACMRPLARALTKNLDSLRTILREQCLHNVDEYTELIKENLIIFDKLFAEFELSYVSAMVSVKTAHEYDMIQEITVLFSETVQRALSLGLLTQEMIDEYDPALMFTIPRLAIVCGVLVFKDGPLNPDNEPWNISEMFRPFQTLLLKIRELLGILTHDELGTLERALCSQDEPSFLLSLEEKRKQAREERRKLKKEKKGNEKVKGSQEPTDCDNGSLEGELTAMEIAERLEALALSFEASHNAANEDTSQSTAQREANSLSDSDDMPPAQNWHNAPETLELSTTPQGQVVDLGTVEDLYRAVNLDSSEILNAPESAFPGNDLFIRGMRMPSQMGIGGDDAQTRIGFHQDSSLHGSAIDNEDNSFTCVENSENHDEMLNDGDGFSLNKCDSKDSGLQSEVVSNSGSMFTISSSDSNQQMLTSDSIPTPSDQNSTDSSEDADSNELPMDENGSRYTQLENSSDSSATVVSVKRCVQSDNQDTVVQQNFAEAISIETDTSVNSDSAQDLPGIETCDPSSSSAPTSSITVGENISCSNDYLIQNCESVGAECDSNFVGNVPEDSHHSQCSDSCDVKESKQLPVNEVSSECDLVSSDSFQNVSDESSKTITDENENGHHSLHSDSVTDIAQTEVTDSDSKGGSLCSDEKTACTAQPTDCSSLAAGSPDSNREDASLCDSNTEVPDESPIKSELDSSSAQIHEVPHNSDAAPSVLTPSSDGSNVKGRKSRPHKDKSSVKTKVTSKRTGKNRGKKARRTESGSSHSRDLRPLLCPHHARLILESHQQLETDRCNSSDTSSYTSECGDQEEIALAIEAAENATRNQVRARFRSSSDMIHRLFVCISGVADQLQTNFAGDLRNILRCVFDMNCPEQMDMCESEKCKDTTPLGAAYRAMSHASRTPRHRHSSLRRDPPAWLPDEQTSDCMACQVPFNFLRRRHHCRNCGKIFCGRCSSSFVPLPHFGQEKAVRVCNRCFMFQVTPFTSE